MVKYLPAMQKTQVQSLIQEDLLEKEMETHSSILAWEIPQKEESDSVTVHGVTKQLDMTEQRNSNNITFNNIYSVQFISVQSISCVQLFMTPWTAAHQASLYSQSLLKLVSIESVMPSNHLILCHPLLLPPQSFPESGSFPVSQFFASGGQSIGVSASTSFLPKNTQD